METEQVFNLMNKLKEMAVEFAPKLILALFLIIAGLWTVNVLKRVIKNRLNKKYQDKTASQFLLSAIEFISKCILFIAVAAVIGVETSSIVAVLGAASLAVGFALQGTLANIAGGILILLLRPFKKDDLIKAQDMEGIVDEVTLFVTVLRTLDNQVIYIPNSSISNGSIVNYTKHPRRRVDLTFGVSYETDFKYAKKVLLNILQEHPLVLNDPEPTVVLGELADSSVNFFVFPWCKTEHYLRVKFELTEKVKEVFTQQNISIPYPQRDVHFYKHES